MLVKLQEMDELGTSTFMYRAQIHTELGELDVAFDLLARAFEDRSALAWYVALAPGLTWPRSDPRMVRLLDRPELKWLERVTPLEE